MEKHLMNWIQDLMEREVEVIQRVVQQLYQTCEPLTQPEVATLNTSPEPRRCKFFQLLAISFEKAQGWVSSKSGAEEVFWEEGKELNFKSVSCWGKRPFP